MAPAHRTRKRLPRGKMRDSQSLFRSYGKAVNWLAIAPR